MHGTVCDKCRYWKLGVREKRQTLHKKRKATGYWSRFGDRAKALATYGSICNDCSWQEEPSILEVHHIDTNKLNHDMGNLVILCPTCHQLRHFKEKTGSWLSTRNGQIIKAGTRLKQAVSQRSPSVDPEVT
jgi:5-methylcytosine-specific restriction endonuclease McrA